MREKIAELRAPEDSITALTVTVDATCSGGSGADCVVLDKLAEPGNAAQ